MHQCFLGIHDTYLYTPILASSYPRPFPPPVCDHLENEKVYISLFDHCHGIVKCRTFEYTVNIWTELPVVFSVGLIIPMDSLLTGTANTQCYIPSVIGQKVWCSVICLLLEGVELLGFG